MVQKVTKSNFEDFIKNNEFVILKCGAPWCGPCKTQDPIIEEFANNNPDVVVGSVNVDDDGEIAGYYGIMGVPSIVIVKNGEEVYKKSGVHQEEQFEELVAKFK